MQKTIALVANTTWNIYNFRLPLMRRLKQEGYRVLAIAPVDEYIHYLNEHCHDVHIPLRHLSASTRNPLRDFLLLWELYRIYQREKPDLVLHYTIKPNIYGSLAARRAGIPSVATVTGLGYTFLHDSFVNRIVRPLYRLALRSVEQVIFHNADDRGLFLREGLVGEINSSVVPGSGVNTNHFRPLPLPKTDRFIFLFIGRLLADKGLREYVAAARRLREKHPEIECWVVGELSPGNPAAVPREEVFGWIDRQDIRYIGRARDVRPYLKRAHALVLPSYREGMPRAVLEAMAMGKPIVTTDAPGCRQTVEPGHNGLLVPVRDVDALTFAMEALYRLDESERLLMGARSRQKAEAEFDDRIISEAYIQLTHRLLSEFSDRPEKTHTKPSQ